MELTVRIECQGFTTVSLEELVELHNYGIMTDEYYAHARNSITELGFSFPFFYWEQEGVKYILDGHQRLRVLKRMKEEGFEIPLLPADQIFAKDKQEAVKKLLAQESRYKDIETKAFNEFLASNEMTVDDIGTFVDIPGYIVDDPSPTKKKEPRMIVCPACSFQFDKSSAKTS